MSDSTKELNEELERAYKQIEQAHQEWIAALDVVDAPIFLHDKDFRILRCNKAYQQCAGLSFKQIIGQRYYEIFPKTTGQLPCCLQPMDNAAEMLVGDVTYLSRSFSVTNEHGVYLYSVHILDDITSRKQAEQTLAASHSLLQSVVENTPARIFWKDRDLCYLGCNTQFAHDAGLSKPEELIGKDDYQMGWHEQADLYRADDRRVMDSGVPRTSYEEPQTTPEGHTIWLSTSKVPLRDNSGRVIGILGIYQDITERKLAEQVLQNEKAFSDTLVQSLPDIFFLIDRQGSLLKWNNNLMELSGLSAEEMSVTNAFDFIHEEDRPLVAQKMELAFETGTASTDARLVLKNGTRHYFLTGSRIETSLGTNAVGIGIDITERKQAEADQRRLNRALSLLSKCNTLLIHAEDEPGILSEICKLIVETGGYMMAWAGLAENDAAKTVRPVAQSGYDEGYLNSINVSWADTEQGRGPTGTAIRMAQTMINHNILTNPNMAPWREAAIKRGYRSSIALPLGNGKQILGALTLYAAEPDAFVTEEVALLEELANDLAYGIVTLRTRVAHEQHAVILRESLEQSIQTIASTLEARDPYTAGHQRRVADLATAIAREMGMPEERLRGLRLAAMIHDVGKIHVPAEILSKPGKLSNLEYMLIKTHPQDGYNILKDVKFPWPIADIIWQHHERLDGSGYPQGLKGDAILLEARILCVADVVEAMSSHRPYRPGLGIEAALDEIVRGRGALYDPQVVDACMALFREKGYAIPK